MEQAVPLQPDWLNFNRFTLRAEKTLPIGPLRCAARLLRMQGLAPRRRRAPWVRGRQSLLLLGAAREDAGRPCRGEAPAM